MDYEVAGSNPAWAALAARWRSLVASVEMFRRFGTLFSGTPPHRCGLAQSGSAWGS